MEVQLSTEAAIVSDTFVALRIGDVQKQSRLASNRTYHFPVSGDGRQRFGRIEVFKRIGDLTVDLSKQDGSQQSVEVPCEHPGLANLSLGLKVKGTNVETMKEARSQKCVKGKSKWDAAQKYIAEYNLESALADAMREVIRHRPEDPFTFLSEQLLLRKATMPVKSAPVPVEAVPQTPMQQSSSPAEVSFDFRPSVGTWLQSIPVVQVAVPQAPVPRAEKPTVVTVLPFGQYCSRNINAYQMPDDLLSKFKPAPRPSPPPPSPPQLSPPAPAVPFAMRASVGSWLTAKPSWKLLKLAKEPVQKSAAELAEQKPFFVKPSVGTWLAPCQERDLEPTLMGMTIGEMTKLPQDELIASFESELERKDREIDELKKTLQRLK